MDLANQIHTDPRWAGDNLACCFSSNFWLCCSFGCLDWVACYLDLTVSLPMHVLEFAAFAQRLTIRENLTRVSCMAGLLKNMRIINPRERGRATLICLDWFHSPYDSCLWPGLVP